MLFTGGGQKTENFHSRLSESKGKNPIDIEPYRDQNIIETLGRPLLGHEAIKKDLKATVAVKIFDYLLFQKFFIQL